MRHICLLSRKKKQWKVSLTNYENNFAQRGTKCYKQCHMEGKTLESDTAILELRPVMWQQTWKSAMSKKLVLINNTVGLTAPKVGYGGTTKVSKDAKICKAARKLSYFRDNGSVGLTHT